VTSSAPRDGVLHIRRLLPAPRERVYEAITDPTKLTLWWGPNGFTCPKIDFQPRVGGSYRITMQPPDGEEFDLLGQFVQVSPPTDLAFTFVWDPPAPDDQPTLAELSLRDERGGTGLNLTQGPFATTERRKLHEDGWNEGLDRLRNILD
jgi:uncharacterized protein YndB with AHSA1/START domain